MSWTRDKIQQLIDNEVEESNRLDYKSPAALGNSDGKKKEITKDISAMANASGGKIIYGISEYQDKKRRHLPERIAPIDNTQFSKEWLDQIASQIQPEIKGFLIDPVHVGPAGNDFCYVVIIPPGKTAHQAKDLRYYRRRNFQSLPMEDYEIREVMARSSSPVIVPELYFDSFHSVFPVERLKNLEIVLGVAIYNDGSVVAKAPYLRLDIGKSFVMNRYGPDGNSHTGLPLIPKRAQRRDREYGGDFTTVIHPGTVRDVCSIVWEGSYDKAYSSPPLEVKVHIAAEGFPIKGFVFEIHLIRIIEDKDLISRPFALKDDSQSHACSP